ncbi:uncharacterized protein GJ701_006304 [Geothlypis trichas]
MGHIPLPAQRPSMEVTTVSPSPASPTEGEDLCETDVTSVATHSVTLLLCLCGLAGNGAVIGLLNLKIPSYGIFDLAVADFLFLLFAVPSAFLFLVEDVSCSHILPLLYLSFLFQLSVVSYYWGLFRLMLNSNVLYVYQLWNLYWHYELHERLVWVAESVQYWAFFALFAVIPAVTFLCPSQEQEHCRVPLISMYTITLLLFVAPMLISSTVDFIKAKWGSQQQQPKRRDIVIIITVLLTLLLSLCNFLQQLSYIDVTSQVAFPLACIHSGIKPFLYFMAGRCWRPCSTESLRLSLQRVLEEPKEKTDDSDDTTRDTAPGATSHCLPSVHPSMEVTTMSPTPASPTEGDDLCERDVTSVAIHCVTLLLCLCGLPGNGAVIGLLGLKIRDYGIFSLAVIDFLFLLFVFPSTLLFLVEDLFCSPILPLLYLNFLFQLSVVSLYWGLFWLVPSSSVLLMYKLCKLCCRWELPLRLVWVVGTVQDGAFFAFFTVIPMVTFLCPSHEQKHYRAAVISIYTITLLLFVAPTLISSTADFIKAKWGSQQQQPERRDIVFFLIVLFIFLFNLCNFLQELGYITVSSEVVFLLTCINSSIKPFIYFLAGGCRRPCSMGSLRLSLQRVFEKPKDKNTD